MPNLTLEEVEGVIRNKANQDSCKMNNSQLEVVEEAEEEADKAATKANLEEGILTTQKIIHGAWSQEKTKQTLRKLNGQHTKLEFTKSKKACKIKVEDLSKNKKSTKKILKNLMKTENFSKNLEGVLSIKKIEAVLEGVTKSQISVKT